jgi:hypothetical protein
MLETDPKRIWALQAETIDCFLGDRSQELDFWRRLSKRCGPRILALMAGTCEIPHALAGMALRVAAIDYCREMLDVAARRQPHCDTLELIQQDVTTLYLPGREFDLAYFGDGDLNRIDPPLRSETLARIRSALAPGGGIAAILCSPSPGSWEGAEQEVNSWGPPAEGVSVRKWSRSRYDADTQVLHVEERLELTRPEAMSTAEYALVLHVTAAEEIGSLLAEAGFGDVEHFGDWTFGPCAPESERWIVTARRR